MIIVDYSQVAISNLMMSLGNHKNAEIDVPMLRHLILNSLRANRVKFHSEFGELVIACDSNNYWRRGVFPYYKANRKKARDPHVHEHIGHEVDILDLYPSVR